MDIFTEIRERIVTAWGECIIPANLKNLHCDERITAGGFNTGEAVVYPGRYCYAFKLKNSSEKPEKCLRLWKVTIDSEYEYQVAKSISEAINNVENKCGLKCFVGFEYKEELLRLDNVVIPGLLMDWGGETLFELVNGNRKPTHEQYRLLANNFYQICGKMKEIGIVHGDLSALNILVDENWNIKFIDYDSLYIPSMGLVDGQSTSGTGGFQHPGRSNVKTMSDDNFSQLIIYISLLAYSHGIVLDDNKVSQNTDKKQETLLFSQSDLSNKTEFKNAAGYKAIKATNDPKLLFYLDALEKAFDVHYDEVPFLCDLIYEPKEKSMPLTRYANFCGTCGHHFDNQTDLYCPDCGKKRETFRS